MVTVCLFVPERVKTGMTSSAGHLIKAAVVWKNLSLIPGCVGAAPIQNIGAYGVEIKDVFHSLEAINIRTGQRLSMSAEECAFGYRDSVFKGALRDQVIITSVTFSLSRKFMPSLGYGYLQKEVQQAANGGEIFRQTGE